MPRRIQPTYTKSPQRYALAAMGDSLTHNIELGVAPDLFWPERVAVGLRALGAALQGRNFARSGATTAQMITRFPRLTQFGTPAIGAIWGGQNDATYTTTVSSATNATTFVIPTAKVAGYAAGSAVKVNGVSRVISSVNTGTGQIVLATALGGTPTAGQSVVVDTQANLTAMLASLTAAGVTRKLIVGNHYLNWSAAGDTTVTPEATGAALRVIQAAAATAGGAVYVDVYAWMKALIVGGTYTQGDHLWHVADSNVHLNAAGEQIVADAILSAIAAQATWTAALV